MRVDAYGMGRGQGLSRRVVGGQEDSQSPGRHRECKKCRSEDSVDISKEAKFKSEISGLNEETRLAVQAFRQEVRQALHSGEFNPTEMAERAPDELKALAEERGVDLEDAFTKIQDHFEDGYKKLGQLRMHHMRTRTAVSTEEEEEEVSEETLAPERRIVEDSGSHSEVVELLSSDGSEANESA